MDVELNEASFLVSRFQTELASHIVSELDVTLPSGSESFSSFSSADSDSLSDSDSVLIPATYRRKTYERRNLILNTEFGGAHIFRSRNNETDSDYILQLKEENEWTRADEAVLLKLLINLRPNEFHEQFTIAAIWRAFTAHTFKHFPAEVLMKKLDYYLEYQKPTSNGRITCNFFHLPSVLIPADVYRTLSYHETKFTRYPNSAGDSKFSYGYVFYKYSIKKRHDKRKKKGKWMRKTKKTKAKSHIIKRNKYCLKPSGFKKYKIGDLENNIAVRDKNENGSVGNLDNETIINNERHGRITKSIINFEIDSGELENGSTIHTVCENIKQNDKETSSITYTVKEKYEENEKVSDNSIDIQKKSTNAEQIEDNGNTVESEKIMDNKESDDSNTESEENEESEEETGYDSESKSESEEDEFYGKYNKIIENGFDEESEVNQIDYSSEQSETDDGDNEQSESNEENGSNKDSESNDENESNEETESDEEIESNEESEGNEESTSDEESENTEENDSDEETVNDTGCESGNESVENNEITNETNCESSDESDDAIGSGDETETDEDSTCEDVTTSDEENESDAETESDNQSDSDTENESVDGNGNDADSEISCESDSDEESETEMDSKVSKISNLDEHESNKESENDDESENEDNCETDESSEVNESGEESDGVNEDESDDDGTNEENKLDEDIVQNEIRSNELTVTEGKFQNNGKFTNKIKTSSCNEICIETKKVKNSEELVNDHDFVLEDETLANNDEFTVDKQHADTEEYIDDMAYLRDDEECENTENESSENTEDDDDNVDEYDDWFYGSPVEVPSFVDTSSDRKSVSPRVTADDEEERYSNKNDENSMSNVNTSDDATHTSDDTTYISVNITYTNDDLLYLSDNGIHTTDDLKYTNDLNYNFDDNDSNNVIPFIEDSSNYSSGAFPNDNCDIAVMSVTDGEKHISDDVCPENFNEEKTVEYNEDVNNESICDEISLIECSQTSFDDNSLIDDAISLKDSFEEENISKISFDDDKSFKNFVGNNISNENLDEDILFFNPEKDNVNSKNIQDDKPPEYFNDSICFKDEDSETIIFQSKVSHWKYVTYQCRFEDSIFVSSSPKFKANDTTIKKPTIKIILNDENNISDSEYEESSDSDEVESFEETPSTDDSECDVIENDESISPDKESIGIEIPPETVAEKEEKSGIEHVINEEVSIPVPVQIPKIVRKRGRKPKIRITEETYTGHGGTNDQASLEIDTDTVGSVQNLTLNLESKITNEASSAVSSSKESSDTSFAEITVVDSTTRDSEMTNSSLHESDSVEVPKVPKKRGRKPKIKIIRENASENPENVIQLNQVVDPLPTENKEVISAPRATFKRFKKRKYKRMIKSVKKDSNKLEHKASLVQKKRKNSTNSDSDEIENEDMPNRKKHKQSTISDSDENENNDLPDRKKRNNSTNSDNEKIESKVSLSPDRKKRKSSTNSEKRSKIVSKSDEFIELPIPKKQESKPKTGKPAKLVIRGRVGAVKCGRPRTLKHGLPGKAKFGHPRTVKLGRPGAVSLSRPLAVKPGRPGTVKLGRPRKMKRGRHGIIKHDDPAEVKLDPSETVKLDSLEIAKPVSSGALKVDHLETSKPGGSEIVNEDRPGTVKGGRPVKTKLGRSAVVKRGRPAAKEIQEPQVTAKRGRPRKNKLV